MASPNKKRMSVLLPLLAVASWLAWFGDKTPSGMVSLSPQTIARLDAQSGKDAVERDLAKGPANRSIARVDVSRASTGVTPAHIEASLPPLFPRAQLIAASPARATKQRDLFASGGWNPPLPRVKPLPVPPPAAPALPYIFLGKKLEDGAWEVFLARGEQSFVVRAGSLIESTYRVDAIKPPQLSMTYLPLNEQQTLAIGELQ
jgi:hypothetical protein